MRWRYFDFTKEQTDSVTDLVDEYNFRSLRAAAFVTAVIFLLFTLFPLLLDHNHSKALVFMVSAMVSFCLYLVCRRMLKAPSHNRMTGRALLLGFYAFMVGVGLYISIFAAPQNPAVTYMIILICLQFLFVLPPPVSLGLNLVSFGLYTLFIFIAKSLPIALMDLQNVCFPTLASIFFSWYLGRVKIKDCLSSCQLTAERNRFQEQSVKDSLTGLGNRRDFMENFKHQLAANQRMDQMNCLLMLDVDYFKEYNDEYGHPSGDQVLRAIGETLLAIGEERGIYAARIGGEEFVMLWTENRAVDAETTALDVWQAIYDLAIPHITSKVCDRITVSVGLYMLSPDASVNTDDIYAQLDKAMYVAKNRGRNQAIRYDIANDTYVQITRERIALLEKNAPPVERRRNRG